MSVFLLLLEFFESRLNRPGFFGGESIECDAADGTCEEIVRDYPFRPFIHSYLEPKYKYLIDVDGNAWSARFKRSLNTGSMVLKSTAHPEVGSPFLSVDSFRLS